MFSSVLFEFCILLSTIFALIYCTPSDSFTLDEYLSSTFLDRKWNGTWLDDDTFMYTYERDAYLFNARTNRTQQYIHAMSLAVLGNNIRVHKVSSDKRYALIKYNNTAVFRYSTLANYAVFDVSTEKLYKISKHRFQYADFLPNSNSLIFVTDNNIQYYKFSAGIWLFNKNITHNGNESIYNGIPDWVYEEEVFGTDSAIWMSPFGNLLAYATFDDSKVPTFTYPRYGRSGKTETQYPEIVSVKYPKVGKPNPSFKLQVYDLTSGADVVVKFPFTANLKAEDYILYDVQWKDANTIVVTFTNRWQTTGALIECDVSSGECKIQQELRPVSGWLSIIPNYIINTTHFAYRDTSGEYDALVIHSKEGKLKLSTGNKVISQIFGHRGNLLYFHANEASNHSQKHVYSVTMTLNSIVTCLTCDLTGSPVCKFASADFSKNLKFMTRICNGPGPSYVDVFDIDKKKVVRVLETNAKVRRLLKGKTMPIVRDLMINIPFTKFTAAVRLLLPSDFSEKKTYPMIVNVYGGPDSKQITDAYGIAFQHYLVTTKKYIYAMIDGRGTSGRERSLMKSLYKKLGQLEISDQIYTTRILRDTIKYIDAKRICVWGWSYGGFATAMILAKDKENIFKCGIAVAPVTNFLYYDTIYTERYMGELKHNLPGYVGTNVGKLASNFRNKNFLLVHGNADDNVHYQQGMLLARELELADVQFQQISYPDENHSLRGVLKHLYHSMDSFFDENLNERHNVVDERVARNSSGQLSLTAIICVFVLRILLRYPCSCIN